MPGIKIAIKPLGGKLDDEEPKEEGEDPGPSYTEAVSALMDALKADDAEEVGSALKAAIVLAQE